MSYVSSLLSFPESHFLFSKLPLPAYLGLVSCILNVAFEHRFFWLFQIIRIQDHAKSIPRDFKYTYDSDENDDVEL